jgi:hypothetical protein
MVRKTKILKDLILAPEILVMPGAHDALAARIIEDVGFKAVSLGEAGLEMGNNLEIIEAGGLYPLIEEKMAKGDVPMYARKDYS